MAFVILLFLLFPSLAFAESLSPAALCHHSPQPSYCMSLLPPQNATVHDSCRSSILQSLLRARRFLNSLDQLLQRRSSLSAVAVADLEDCRTLADLNVDFLSNSLQIINKAAGSLADVEVEGVQTMLSAVLTNHETCLEGLQDTFVSSHPNLVRKLVSPLTVDKKFYGASLSLFTKGWVPAVSKQKPELSRHHPPQVQVVFRDGHLSLAMSNRTRAIFEAASGRKLDLAFAVPNMLHVKDIAIVSKDGTGDFTTINDALSAAPDDSSSSEGYFLIYVSAGVYEEYISIDKKKTYLMMMGDGINRTIITGNHSYAYKWHPYRSATFAVHGKGFMGVNITFRNTAGPENHQAVAVRNSANLSLFYSCSFEGYQDTLYAHSMKQFYRECDIYGTVDFICGNAAAVFQNCNIYARKPMRKQFNAITAQSRESDDQNTGFSIHNCTIRAAEDLAGTAATYLGRPWKPLSRTVYMESFMDNLIDGAGWHFWDNDSESRLDSLYYAEYNNSGPGSNTSHRVTWNGYHVINSSIAADFTVSRFLLGDYWLPLTGVPYTGGLINS
ncbi:probable pectinesterase/pectinesterase inhibitor 41 [Neltuma alba]|uniref:probable pectinesterase/pectinesterase inhibitor 41 n=1 Tax=Neltuma alba TaxID=207710 RepID=UPI0010A48C4A|nr:probable pectinesterase/pectinesterase inhibitor 41 [Prosopis alba]